MPGKISSSPSEWKVFLLIPSRSLNSPLWGAFRGGFNSQSRSGIYCGVLHVAPLSSSFPLSRKRFPTESLGVFCLVPLDLEVNTTPKDSIPHVPFTSLHFFVISCPAVFSRYFPLPSSSLHFFYLFFFSESFLYPHPRMLPLTSLPCFLPEIASSASFPPRCVFDPKLGARQPRLLRY